MRNNPPADATHISQTLIRAIDLGAIAIGLPSGVFVTNDVEIKTGTSLISIADAVDRLIARRILVSVQDPQLQYSALACTETRYVRAPTVSNDSCRRRAVDKVRTIDSFYVYCIDASIRRALVCS